MKGSPPPALLFDFGPVPAAHCDDCIEDLFKALAANPAGEERAIWQPHENPWLRDLVEDVTRRIQARLAAIQDALLAAMGGEPVGELAKAAPPWLRWSPADFAEARARLEGKPPALYTLDDWLLLADYLVQRYLPDGVIADEADYLSLRAQMAGKIQAAMDAGADISEDASRVLALLPTTFRRIPERVLTDLETRILEVARARVAEHISDLAQGTRRRMKAVILEHVQAQVLGQGEGTARALQQRLLDGFGTLNRDWRRIAVTEAGECHNSGYIAARPVGSLVRRREVYRGTCDFCRSLDGRTFRVADPADPKKDGERDVWLGKSNAGRSASPRRREGNALVEREPHEMWWPAAGVQHPNCRGRWEPVADAKAPPPGVNPDFAAYVAKMLKKPAS